MLGTGKDEERVVLCAAVGQQLQQAGVADSTATPQKQRRIMIGDVASGV